MPEDVKAREMRFGDGDEVLSDEGMTVSYEVDGYASIHYHPDPNLSDKKKLAVFEKGLDELARRIDRKKQKGEPVPAHVAATSWLVASNPEARFFTRKGFTLVKDVRRADYQRLISVYEKRRDEDGMSVPEEFKTLEPKIALLEIDKLLARLAK